MRSTRLDPPEAEVMGPSLSRRPKEPALPTAKLMCRRWGSGNARPSRAASARVSVRNPRGVAVRSGREPASAVSRQRRRCAVARIQCDAFGVTIPRYLATSGTLVRHVSDPVCVARSASGRPPHARPARASSVPIPSFWNLVPDAKEHIVKLEHGPRIERTVLEQMCAVCLVGFGGILPDPHERERT